jgi:hypothetical protein
MPILHQRVAALALVLEDCLLAALVLLVVLQLAVSLQEHLEV